jgi:hypothetical protein
MLPAAKKLEMSLEWIFKTIYHHKVTLAVIFALGLICLGLTNLAIYLAPSAAKHAKGIARAYNDIGLILHELFDWTKKVVVGIEATIDFFRGKPIPSYTARPFQKVSAHEIANVAYSIPLVCDKFKTMPEIIAGAFFKYASFPACKLLRDFYTTPSNATLVSMAGFASGHRDFTPAPIGFPGDCRIMPGSPPEMESVCYIMGAGILILELFFPLIIGLIIAIGLLGSIVDGVKFVLKTSWEFTMLVYRAAHMVAIDFYHAAESGSKHFLVV